MSLFKRKPKSPEDSTSPKDLSVAYGIQSKNKKKMAKGGPVEISAKTEPLPSLQAAYGDKNSLSRNSGSKPQEKNFVDEKRSSIDLIPTPEELQMLSMRRTKMAEGGWIEGDPTIDDAFSDRSQNMISGKSTKHSPEDPWADGEDTADNASVAQNIRNRKKFADGGMVDIKQNAVEGENEADEFNMDAAGKENYSEASGLDELDYDTDKSIGDDIESDLHDMVSKIRSKMKSKQ